VRLLRLSDSTLNLHPELVGPFTNLIMSSYRPSLAGEKADVGFTILHPALDRQRYACRALSPTGLPCIAMEINIYALIIVIDVCLLSYRR
jgi:hypothetical protein